MWPRINVSYPAKTDVPIVIFLGQQYEGLTEVFFEMFGTEHQHFWPTPSIQAERWRYVTLEHFVGSMGKEAIAQGRINHVSSVSEKSMEDHWKTMVNNIAVPLGRLYRGTDHSRIKSIVDKAFNLVLQMSLQKFRLQVVFPEIGDTYVTDITPELSSVTESDEVLVGTVGFIVNPGLAKWGDAHGKNLDQRLDLVPSLVFIEGRDH